MLWREEHRVKLTEQNSTRVLKTCMMSDMVLGLMLL